MNSITFGGLAISILGDCAGATLVKQCQILPSMNKQINEVRWRVIGLEFSGQAL